MVNISLHIYCRVTKIAIIAKVIETIILINPHYYPPLVVFWSI